LIDSSPIYIFLSRYRNCLNVRLKKATRLTLINTVAVSNSFKNMNQVYSCLCFFAQRSINIRDYLALNNIYCNDHVE